MNPMLTPCQRRKQQVRQATTATPTGLKTTLYEVMATLQSVAAPTEDALVNAIVVHWLRSGRMTLVSKATVAA